MKLLLSILAVVEGMVITPVLAQDGPLLLRTGRELLKDADLYLGRIVVISDGYCFYDQPNFVCIGTDTPFEVKAPTLDGPLAAAIKENCGDIEGAEHNPTPHCAYSFRFVPRSYKLGIGDFVLHDRVQSNKKIMYLQTESIEPLSR